ncbi:MAG: DUF4190 domain-containing protein [Verrucomicrobiales bacterium]
MATIKVACSKCGQKVSGDETFFGTSVECPVCSAQIYFPESAPDSAPAASGSSPSAKDAPEAPARYTGPQPVPPRDDEEVKPDSEAGELQPAFASEGVAQVKPSEVEPESSESDDIEEGERGAVPSPIFGAISMVSAVLGIVTCVSPLFAPIAIIFGHLAGSKARHSPVQPAPGQTLGAVGMMIGYVNLVFTILGLIVLLVLREMEVIPDGFIRNMISGEEPAE